MLHKTPVVLPLVAARAPARVWAQTPAAGAPAAAPGAGKGASRCAATASAARGWTTACACSWRTDRPPVPAPPWAAPASSAGSTASLRRQQGRGVVAMCRSDPTRLESPLRRAAKAKTADAWADWWREAAQAQDLAGALWATLTHARRTPAFEHQVLGEVRMLQHQVGMARRVDLQRFEGLVVDSGVLARGPAGAQHVRDRRRGGRRRPGDLPGRLHQPRRLLAREGPLQAQRQALHLRRRAGQHRAQARTADAGACACARSHR